MIPLPCGRSFKEGPMAEGKVHVEIVYCVV
jgi:hypothetical protein